MSLRASTALYAIDWTWNKRSVIEHTTSGQIFYSEFFRKISQTKNAHLYIQRLYICFYAMLFVKLNIYKKHTKVFWKTKSLLFWENSCMLHIFPYQSFNEYPLYDHVHHSASFALVNTQPRDSLWCFDVIARCKPRAKGPSPLWKPSLNFHLDINDGTEA